MVFTDIQLVDSAKTYLLHTYANDFAVIGETADTIGTKCNNFIEALKNDDLQKFSDPRVLKDLFRKLLCFLNDTKERVELIQKSTKDASEKKIKIEEIQQESQRQLISIFKDEKKYEPSHLNERDIKISPVKRKMKFTENNNEEKESSAKRPKITKDIDSSALVIEISRFLRKNEISRTYFAKKVLSISHVYFYEILNHPMAWFMLSKSGKKPYEKMNEFINDKEQVSAFIEEYQRNCKNQATMRHDDAAEKNVKIPMVLPITSVNIDKLKINDDYDEYEEENANVEISIKLELD